MIKDKNRQTNEKCNLAQKFCKLLEGVAAYSGAVDEDRNSERIKSLARRASQEAARSWGKKSGQA